MANKKKSVEENNKKIDKKELKKEKEFEKLVAEEEIEEVEEFDDDEYYDDLRKENDIDSDSNNDIKVLKILTCVCICVAAVSLFISLIILSKIEHINSFYVEKTPEEESSVTEDYDTSMFKEISVDDFIDMFDEDDNKIRFVYTGTSRCSYCVAFLPALQQSIEEYDYTLYYLNTDNVTGDDVSEIVEFDDDLEENFPSTPMVYAVKNGKVIDFNNGYTEYSTYVKFLKDNDVEKNS